MYLTQLHLMLNHLPILLVALGGLIELYVLIYKKSNPLINRIGLIFLALAAVTVIPVFLTGEASEESIEKLVLSEQLIEQHEEAARLALFTILGVGVIALLALIRNIRTQVQNRYLVVSAVFCAFISFGFIARAAHLGGKIRHTEITSAKNFNGNPNSEDHD